MAQIEIQSSQSENTFSGHLKGMWGLAMARLVVAREQMERHLEETAARRDKSRRAKRVKDILLETPRRP